ncbi:sulfur carrier protein adenylyltransferase ThiF [Vibrio ponticus]|nr:sulfur carrier protein adenylyltransferase ThiF [Vibrio ponticus]
MLTDNQFLRYQRQVALPELGEIGQQRLFQSHVLIIGCGGLGSAAALYLAGAGVGRLVLVDDDNVEASNLHSRSLTVVTILTVVRSMPFLASCPSLILMFSCVVSRGVWKRRSLA